MNNEKEIIIPPFVQDYIDKVDGKGLNDFVKVSAEYQKEKEDYPAKYATQSAHLKDHNRAAGTNKILNYNDGLKDIETRYNKRAYQTAKQHGYTGPDPNQPSDKEFTKQGEKFQGMIDQAKERQQEKATQDEQEKETSQGQEKKNTETLKAQQPYQQNQPKVEFKEMEQQEPSGKEEQSREQQRAAFLEQIKQTREQQTQRQQGQQPEI